MNIDRLSIRSRPRGLPLMHQNWGKLLFMHWPIHEDVLRPFIPLQLSIDTLDGSAWIGVIPFTMWGIRGSFLPPLPTTSAFHELNVRTYVHYDGVPGVWFFSLDAASSLAVWGARRFYHLPYFKATMSLDQRGETINYFARRTDQRGRPASFKSSWTIGEQLAQSTPDSLKFFLTERYCLYSFHRAQFYRARIFHEPWRLRRAQLISCQSTVVESLGIPQPQSKPLLHYAESISVDIWPLHKVSGTRTVREGAS